VLSLRCASDVVTRILDFVCLRVGVGGLVVLWGVFGVFVV